MSRHIVRTSAAALLAAGALALSGCAAWDQVPASASDDLRKELSAAEAVDDPRALTGVSVVTEMSEVEPDRKSVV